LIDEILEVLLLFDDILLSRNIIVRFEIVRNANIVELNFLILSLINRVHFDFKENSQSLNECHKIIFFEKSDFFVANHFYRKTENFDMLCRFLLDYSSNLYRRQKKQRIINLSRKD
jgi:hypothetical protein